jgi:eukaryotic-like serine/threonine-protein kinase
MIYSLADLDINGLSCNYWEMRVDPRTGERHGTPKRLTNWAAFGTDGTKATADGRWLAFKKWRVERSVYIADFELNGARITTPRRLTHSAANEFPMAWTPDSKAVLFLSNRTGRWESSSSR